MERGSQVLHQFECVPLTRRHHGDDMLANRRQCCLPQGQHRQRCWTAKPYICPSNSFIRSGIPCSLCSFLAYTSRSGLRILIVSRTRAARRERYRFMHEDMPLASTKRILRQRQENDKHIAARAARDSRRYRHSIRYAACGLFDESSRQREIFGRDNLAHRHCACGVRNCSIDLWYYRPFLRFNPWSTNEGSELRRSRCEDSTDTVPLKSWRMRSGSSTRR